MDPSSKVATMTLHDAVIQPQVDLAATEALILADPAQLDALSPHNALTPLQVAARRSHSGLIRLLANSGADLERKGKNGETPLLTACQGGSLYAVHSLVQCGSNVRATDLTGKSAMHYAAHAGAIHIMHYLSVTQGMGFQCTEHEGNTPLHIAVMSGNLDTIKYLVRHGRADVRAANRHGTTPLHIAAALGSSAMAWTLMQSTRENLLAYKNVNGYTPVQLASMGTTRRHSLLARDMLAWSAPSAWLKPYVLWVYYLILPGTSLLLAMLSLCHLWLSVAICIAAALIVFGFFRPFMPHRIPHVAGWPNPALLGALISGLIHTFVCYFAEVFPHASLWPDNMIWFLFIAIDYIIIIYLLVRLQITDPGLDRVGKVGADGKPMTILDVAKQGEQESIITYSFCTICEIVIPDRTKHCKLCNGCCSGFDHHCMWLGKCIGYNNHRMFVLFTLCLGLDNFLFVRDALACLVQVTGSYSPLELGMEVYHSEQWVFFLIVCNFCTGVFAFANLYWQLQMVSRLETTYFDMSGRAAYKKRRERQNVSLIKRLRRVHTFCTNYSRWYRNSDPTANLTSLSA